MRQLQTLEPVPASTLGNGCTFSYKKMTVSETPDTVKFIFSISNYLRMQKLHQHLIRADYNYPQSGISIPNSILLTMTPGNRLRHPNLQ